MRRESIVGQGTRGKDNSRHSALRIFIYESEKLSMPRINAFQNVGVLIRTTHPFKPSIFSSCLCWREKVLSINYLRTTLLSFSCFIEQDYTAYLQP